MPNHRRDDVLRIPALTDLPWFLPGFAISVVIGYLVRHRAARFLGASPLLGWVVVSLGIIASATLTPLREGAFEGGARAAGCDFSRVGLASLKDILELGDTFLNILLFIPLGAAFALLPRSRRKAWWYRCCVPSPRGQRRAACGGLHIAEPRQDLDRSAGRARVGRRHRLR